MKQLIYFSASWCPGCKTMTPVINGMKKQIQVADINVDYDASNVSKYNISSIPTIVLLEDGEEIRRFTGTMTGMQLVDWLNK